jgi:hypothetical protein
MKLKTMLEGVGAEESFSASFGDTEFDFFLKWNQDFYLKTQVHEYLFPNKMRERLLAWGRCFELAVENLEIENQNKYIKTLIDFGQNKITRDDCNNIIKSISNVEIGLLHAILDAYKEKCEGKLLIILNKYLTWKEEEIDWEKIVPIIEASKE